MDYNELTKQTWRYKMKNVIEINLSHAKEKQALASASLLKALTKGTPEEIKYFELDLRFLDGYTAALEHLLNQVRG